MLRASCNPRQCPPTLHRVRLFLSAGFYPDADDAASVFAELRRELPSGHLLDGITVDVFAWRDGATDDVLFQHRGQPNRFTVVHLSWLGRTEINAQHPTVEFDGTFAEFLAQEEHFYGLTPPTQ